MSKLRMPCPFCGGTDLEEVASFTYVICTTCRAEGPVGQAGKGMDAWNLRATQPAAGEPAKYWAFHNEFGELRIEDRWDVAKHLPFDLIPLITPPAAAHGDEAGRKMVLPERIDRGQYLGGRGDAVAQGWNDCLNWIDKANAMRAQGDGDD